MIAAKSVPAPGTPPPASSAPRPVSLAIVPPAVSRTFGDITPVLVHDFKGPLSAVALNLDFVLEQLPPDSSFDVVRGALAECRHASDRIFRVISNLLDVARSEEGRLPLCMSAVALPELFIRVVAAYEIELTQRDVALQIRAPDELPTVEGDVDLLSRVLHNLVDNAIRNTKARGRVVLSAQLTTDAIEIRVANDGTPIPLPIRSRLFQRTVGAECDGLGVNRGVGLYFCRLALEELGASITLSDEPDFSVCFLIRYPIPVKSVR